MPKVSLYVRLSKEDFDKMKPGDESTSIQNQKNLLLQYALSQGWEIYGVYTDEDYNGSDRNRPAFKRLLADAEARKFDIILCKTQSRFTREISVAERYINKLFPAWGIRFVSIVDHADSAGGLENLRSRQINGLLNEWYLEDLSASIKAAMGSMRKEGRFTGAFAPYGYLKDPRKKNHLIVDPEVAPIVKEVFHKYCSGYGMHQIAELLTRRGVPTPSAYKYQKGQGNGVVSQVSMQWSAAIISKMLRNEMYTGAMVQGKRYSASYKVRGCMNSVPRNNWIVVDGMHDPIIPPQLWDQTQELLRCKSRPDITGRKVDSTTCAVASHYFTLKLKCKCCGKKMGTVTPRSYNANGRIRRYYRCTNKECAERAFIAHDTIERYMADVVQERIKQYFDIDEAERKVQLSSSLHHRVTEFANQRQILESRKQEDTNCLVSLYTDLKTGLIDLETYQMLHDEFSRGVKAKSQEISRLDKQIEHLEKSAADMSSISNELSKALSSQPFGRELLLHLVDKILVGVRQEPDAPVPIEIYWRFCVGDDSINANAEVS